MTSSFPDYTTVRQYLLGRLDEQPQLENDLSDGVLIRDDLAEMVESIEDEIIEEYLDGTLDTVDKDAVEKYFLLPPDRKEKLRFARLLRQRFETTSRDSAGPQLDLSQSPGAVSAPNSREAGSVLTWSSGFRTYWQVAALILLFVLSLTYMGGLRKKQKLLEAELSREREFSVRLAHGAPLLQSSAMGLTLVWDRSSDRSRGAGMPTSHIEIPPSTKRIVVDIALPRGASGPHDVRLETNGGKTSTWAATLLPLMSAKGDVRLIFDVPAASIDAGICSFVVSSSDASIQSPKYYDFFATVAK
jgi:hypothetical protein